MYLEVTRLPVEAGADRDWGSHSLVGIGKFNLLFLWLTGVVRDVSGRTALTLASMGGHLEIERLLVEAAAKRGRIPLYIR